MPSLISSGQVSGLRPDIIDIEVDVSRGLKSHTIVGLPDSAVKEAKERITAALKNSGFPSVQKGNKKIIVSLAPADLRKEGPIFDVAIALAHLVALEELDMDPAGKLFLGELSLGGEVRPIKGALLIAQKAKEKGFKEIYLPRENAQEASLIEGVSVYGVRTLSQLIIHLGAGGEKIISEKPVSFSITKSIEDGIDMSDIQGQESAKRGLEIAAAGGHNIAMSGPPGTGKTLLAKAFTHILPALIPEEIIEVTGIHSAAGTLETEYISHPPLRTPHHSASYVSLVGGGTWPRPGEITLAHRGVLFLDEFPEFDRRVIEALRQPLEDRVISVTRAKGSLRFPANCILIATMNPCPCGKRGVREGSCTCSGQELARYERKLSGPIVDRIDMWVTVGAVDHKLLSSSKRSGDDSTTIAKRVKVARERQRERFKNEKGMRTNSDMGVRQIAKYAPLTTIDADMLAGAAKRMNLSARGYHRVVKLARTIADLAGSENIEQSHILEALQYRPKTNP